MAVFASRLLINCLKHSNSNLYITAKFSNQSSPLKLQEYHQIADETLHSLIDYFEGLSDKFQTNADYDVKYADGVLTVALEKGLTYVINKQTPNKQIWLSSPFSGPKRYDFDRSLQGWIYVREQRTMHALLGTELSLYFNCLMSFDECLYSGAKPSSSSNV